MSTRLIPERLRDVSNIAEHNFLINGIIVDFLSQVAPRFARGVLVDVGCGEKPYKRIFAPHVTRHLGIDIRPGTSGAVDVVGDAYSTNLPDGACDTLLCTEVLEHLEEPARALAEMRRILKADGHVILTVPFFWHVHEAPRDFFRYSEYGLRHLFQNAGFEVVTIRPLTGFVVTFAQLGIYYARTAFPRARRLLRGPFWLAQLAAAKLNDYDNSRGFTSIYALVARRRA